MPKNNDALTGVRLEYVLVGGRTLVGAGETEIEDVQMRVKTMSNEADGLVDSMVGCLRIDNEQIAWIRTQAVQTRDLHVHLVFLDGTQLASGRI